VKTCNNSEPKKLYSIQNIVTVIKHRWGVGSCSIYKQDARSICFEW